MIFVFDLLDLVWLIISRSIHVAANGMISFFLCPSSIPLCICITPSSSIHLLMYRVEAFTLGKMGNHLEGYEQRSDNRWILWKMDPSRCWVENVHFMGREGFSYINVFLLWDSVSFYLPNQKTITSLRVDLGLRTVAFIQTSRPGETLTTLSTCSPIFLVDKPKTFFCYWMFTGSPQSAQLCSSCRQKLDKRSLPDEQTDNSKRVYVV